jgi:RHH-type proline utilization regulon transcriptional repressor/proline dehydrogenase/delta 1-pyrroline-5-carboxylate dehydrogenase
MNRSVAISEQVHGDSPLQHRIEAKGLEIFERMRGGAPRVFSPRNLTGQLMSWSMRDERLKTQLFRFVDVLPALGSAQEVAKHAREYLSDGATASLPVVTEWVIKLAPQVPWLASFLARQSVTQMAKTFILAPSGAEALSKLEKLRKQSLAFTADLLGETVVSDAEAEKYEARYFELIDSLAAAAAAWPRNEQIDGTDRGESPRVNVSVKISALGSPLLATDPEGALERLKRRLQPLLRKARDRGVFINLDMEHTALKQLTLDLFMRLLDEPELRDYPHFGIALQAYLRDTEADFEQLLAWARPRNRRFTIRLIKGAYWDYETILAGQRGWPRPVFARKWETDAAFERIARRMLESSSWIDSAFGTHNIRSIAACLAHAESLGRPQNSYEFQMLYGMAEPIKRALAGMGYRVRDYCPIGEVLPGMSYLVRRLLENTSNEGFLRSTFAEHTDTQQLLRDPQQAEITIDSNGTPRDNFARDSATSHTAVSRAAGSGESANLHDGTPGGADLVSRPEFENEPLLDFTMAANRDRMRSAIQKVRGELGRKYPLLIGGQSIWTPEVIVSTNPARPVEVIGRVAKAGTAEAEAAVVAARSAALAWGRTAIRERTRKLDLLADLLCQERFELAALEILETGKTWTEADADVVEAIDFCRFYAKEMRSLAGSRYIVPGEISIHHHIPRGVAVVIAPWNFPLAILCGMTVAALVTGNSVIVKPSEQSPVLAARFLELLHQAGVPPAAANFLPGRGSVVGAYLAEHALVDLVAFTGSREVGLKIWEAAGRVKPGQRQLKKVICEMGGKNALIVDSDADLDEAIPAIIHSAFGYQGQKCSALSRLIVLADIHDRLLERLVAATRDMLMGPPEEPGTMLGPLIDQAAAERVREYIQLGCREGMLTFQGKALENDGWYVPPAIFTGVSPHARIAQEEIFGPVLCLLQARDLDEAIDWANSTPYALTGGFFSRSPANIEQVRAEFEVGNLYINRGITGAIVARHPFGGFKMSGAGTKAGGSEYLLNFMFPRVVTENVMRRGFAPEIYRDDPGGE